MCGIWGLLQPAENPRGLDAVHAALAHRGPDADGIVRTQGAILGHRRLSIIDLSPSGAQPMWDVTGQTCISFNGEIYNYRELRDECLRAGLQFRSSSDTEVILNLYLLHGEQSFDRLNGMFAFALHDVRRGVSFLVRDRMGIKPLYYAQTDQGLLFASDLHALMVSGTIPFAIDRNALEAYLQLDYVPTPMSMIRSVRKLEGGTLLAVSSTETALRRYAIEKTTETGSSAQDDVDAFGPLIHRVVERQMLADVPLGVFLSGGIDSSIIARTAADLAGKISTFSVAFDDPSFDERSFAETVASAIGSDHHIQILTPAAMLDLIPMVASILGEPIADGSIFPTCLLSAFTRTHVKVALSGDGADELFAGYPTHRLWRTGALMARIPSRVRAAGSRVMNALLPVTHENLSFDFRLRKFVDGLDRDPILQNQRWLGTFTAEELGELLVEPELVGQTTLDELLHRPSSEANGLEQILRTDQRFYMQDQVLVKVDRASMAASLEVRVPFLDDEMVSFARSLQAARKLRGGESKWLLRRYASRFFPESIWKRPKKGFGVPLGRWFRDELKSLVRDVLSPRFLSSSRFFRPDAIAKLLAEHEHGIRDHRKKIFNLLLFALWYEDARTWGRN